MPRSTPAVQGYHMPAEWESHTATWLAWPHNRDTWPDQLEQVQAIYVQLIKALQAGETVYVLVNDAATAADVQQQLAAEQVPLQRVITHVYPMVDAWLRDSGPSFVTGRENRRLALVDWRFTAWGGKYPEMLADDALPEHIATHFNLPRFTPGIALEGGAIDLNGQGSCLTTEQCLLNPNRNPHLQRADIERYLGDYLGARHTIWLGEGIEGDDTDGHIDDIARFVTPDTVVCARSEDPQDANYKVLQDNYRRLQRATDQDGRTLRVIALPMPGPVGPADAPLPASYANFYIANRVVLAPTYDHPNDQVAIEILREVFPNRRVLSIPCEPLVWGLGAIHCITQQQPATL